MYKIVLTKQASKDQKNIKDIAMKNRIKNLLKILEINPFQNPPSYEKLVGNLSGYLSRRVNIQHRLVYQVLENETNLLDANGKPFDGIIKIIRMWTHYSNV